MSDAPLLSAAGLTKTYTLTTRWLRDTNRVEAEEKLMGYQLAAGPPAPS